MIVLFRALTYSTLFIGLCYYLVPRLAGVRVWNERWGHWLVWVWNLAIAAGMVWGSKLGVQFSISLVALKALPVLILGGFTSIPGAIVGGLIIGAGEKLAEVMLGPYLIRWFDLAGGGIENWFAYVLALVFLLFRPQGLFGEKIIERI